MKKFYISTLGCKVNQYESDGIAGELISNGWVRERQSDKADICIINTCAVTSKAAMQSRQTIRSIIRTNPHAIIIVTGCHAQTSPDEIQKIKGVHCVTDHKNKFNIAKAVLLYDKTHKNNVMARNNNGKNNKTDNSTALKNHPMKSNSQKNCINKDKILPAPRSNKCTDSTFHSFPTAVTGDMTRAYL